MPIMKMLAFNAKRILISICLIVFLLNLTACLMPEDKVLASLGKYEQKEYFTSGGFQDYTDYAKYRYSSAEVEENKYLKKINENDLDTINTYLDDFESWIRVVKEADASSEVVVNYDFERAIVDTEDYFYIDSEEVTWDDGTTSVTSFDIYFFDTKNQVLYYFHNNI